MFLMYVDESGDPGLINSPTRYFVLTGLVMHELRWHEYLNRLIDFRQRMRTTYGLKLREEFHSSHLISSPGVLAQRIRRNDRLSMIRNYADELAQMTDLNIINIVVDKSTKPAGYDVVESAWTTLLQRFENTISHRNFVGPQNSDERGIVLSDRSDEKKITGLIRRRRRYNPVPHSRQVGSGYRNLPSQYVVEDAVFRDSRDTYFIQSSDLSAYLLYQYLSPNAYFKKTNAKGYFLRLIPVLCKRASKTDPLGIVRL